MQKKIAGRKYNSFFCIKTKGISSENIRKDRNKKQYLTL
jgi:hypothetical protein